MKLLYCPDCDDIFNLQLHTKSCSCGKTKGRYVDQTYAEVNGHGFSLAMGNGSFNNAISRANSMAQDFRHEGDAYRRHETTIICWARPHEGPANSHTRINEDL